MMVSSPLPDDLVHRAFVASNGELGFAREDATRAASLLADRELAILGGEVWLIVGEHSWTGIIPQRNSSVPGVYAWTCKPEGIQRGETWAAFCERTKSHALSMLSTLTPEDDVPIELRDRLRFNLTWVDHAEYAALQCEKGTVADRGTESRLDDTRWILRGGDLPNAAASLANAQTNAALLHVSLHGRLTPAQNRQVWDLLCKELPAAVVGSRVGWRLFEFLLPGEREALVRLFAREPIAGEPDSGYLDAFYLETRPGRVRSVRKWSE